MIRKFILVSCLTVGSFVFNIPAYAQTVSPSASSSANVKATVVGRLLTLSGIIAPNASVVLSADGSVYKGTVADSNGVFSIPEIAIAPGLTEFCLEAVDVKRLGSSLACFPIKPAITESTQKDIFLPPTLGLQHDQIVEGSDAVVFGYSMPTAQVDVEVKNGQKYTVAADAAGYYQYTLPAVKAGSYQLVAGATYKAKASAPSLRPALLKTISQTAALTNWLKQYWWIILLPLLVLAAGFFFWWYQKRALRNKKQLHHWWFVGY